MQEVVDWHGRLSRSINFVSTLKIKCSSLLLMGKYCFMDDSNLYLNLRQEDFVFNYRMPPMCRDIVNHLGLAIKCYCGIWKVVYYSCLLIPLPSLLPGSAFPQLRAEGIRSAVDCSPACWTVLLV